MIVNVLSFPCLHRNGMSALHKADWFLFNLNVNISFTITFFYWVFVHPDFDDYDHSYFNHFAVTLNTVVNLLDLVLCAKPWRIHHFYAPLAFGLL